MTKKLILRNLFVATALMLCVATYAAAAEVTGTLSSGVSDPGSGSISGTVTGGGGGSISGTVTGGGGGGSSSGGGGGGGGSSNNPPGEVLGASNTFTPGFPNAGYPTEEGGSPWAMGVLVLSLLALSYGALRGKNELQ